MTDLDSLHKLSDKELSFSAAAHARLVESRFEQIKKATEENKIVDQSYLYTYLSQEAEKAAIVIGEVSVRRQLKNG
jgi:hypothetical protein